MNINLIAPINGTSYGLTSSYFLNELNKAGYNISLFPLYQLNPSYSKFVDNVDRGLTNAKKFDPKGLSLTIHHQGDLALSIGSPKIGFTIFELEDLTQREIHHISSLDKIIVPTEWHKNIIRKYIDMPIGVVPLGVDPDYFYPMKNIDKDRPFVFSMIGKWERRKNQAQVIEAFGKAFSSNDDVKLQIVCGTFADPSIAPLIEQQLQKALDDCPIKDKVYIHPFNNFVAPQTMASIYNNSDCFILVSRTEGWGLPTLEAMACGCPIISSDTTGQSAFVNEKNSLIVHPIGKEKAEDGYYFHGFSEWATFSTDEIVEKMRYAYSNLKGELNKEGIKTSRQLTWEKAGIQLAKELKEI